MPLLDKDFIAQTYPALLGNLRDNNYLSQEDLDTLLFDFYENQTIYLVNISTDKAEIIRKAVKENFDKSFKMQN